MIGGLILLVGLAIVAGVTWWHASRKTRKRATWRAIRFSPEETAVVMEYFPLWEKVPDTTRRSAEGWARVFLQEKSFEACGGLERVTDDMRLVIAVQACLLIAHRESDYYESLRSILLYPDAYRAKDEMGSEDVRLGESWSSGSVVLAWESVMKGAGNPRDGHNVVLHEFAHQLDQEDGAADGVPSLDDGDDYGRWSRAMAPAYRDFVERVNSGKRSVLDDYGATNPAEFFAVATETFFEKPDALLREEPEVFAELSAFYGMNPATW